MSIESGSTAVSHRPLGTVDHRGGKKVGKVDTVADASSNFSMLMGMLAVAEDNAGSTDPAVEAALGVAVNAPVDLAVFDKNMPPAQSAYASTAINLKSMQTSTDTVMQSLAASSGHAGGLTLDATGGCQTANAFAVAQGGAAVATQSVDFEENRPLAQSVSAQEAGNLKALLVPLETSVTKQGQFSVATQVVDVGENRPLAQSGSAQVASNLQGQQIPQGASLGPVQELSGGLRVGTAGPAPVAAGFGAEKKVVMADDVGAVIDGAGAVAAQTDVTAGVSVQPELRSGTRGMAQVQNLSGVQADLKESRMHVSTLDMAARSEVGSTLSLINGAAESMLRTQEPLAAKSPGARFGDASAGAFGTASGVSTRADSAYEIEATAAAVPDTAIAETVSYWVTQGVQNAELTLEGFGSDPVEVSISLNGDQAQIDFRTDQADVRQALEAATAELRDLLLGEGLQLAGVSVGASGGRGAQGDAQQSNPGARPDVLMQEPGGVATPRSIRSSNPSVGRSLDLFV